MSDSKNDPRDEESGMSPDARQKFTWSDDDGIEVTSLNDQPDQLDLDPDLDDVIADLETDVDADDTRD